MSGSEKVLIYGGCGALGSTCVRYFKSKGWWVCSVDLYSSNENADASVIVTKLDDWEEQYLEISKKVSEVLDGHKLDAICCIAGGWAGGNASSQNLVKNADLMWKQSVWTSVIASGLASHYLKENGLLQLTGAAPALAGTPGMIGYGLAKAAVHQLAKSLAEPAASGLPSETYVATILPVTLDTEMNRKGMPDEDFTSWTPLMHVAELLHTWAIGEDREASGSLMKLVTEGGHTKVEVL